MKFEIRYDPKHKRIYAPRRTVLTFVSIIIVLALLVGLFIYRIGKDKNRLQTPEEQSQPLKLGKPPVDPEKTPSTKEAAASVVIEEIKKSHNNKFNIIFFYDGYQDQKEALLYIKVMQEALDLTEPFKSLKDLIAFKIFTTEGQKCEVEHKVKKILRCDREMVESFNRLGIERFKLVILSPLDFVPSATIARGKNSAIYMPTFQGALTREELFRWLGQFFMHELGHSLGLRDEYSRERPNDSIINEQAAAQLSSNRAYQPEKPNCAPDLSTAEKWWGEYVGTTNKVGYFKGCAGRSTYYYPQEDTLMSAAPATETFGQVSEDYLRGAISCFYSNKESIIFQAGFEATHSAKLKNCESFKKEYPSFWKE